MLGSFTKNCIGLDIGSSSIKTVMLSKNQNSYAVRNAYTINISDDNNNDPVSRDQLVSEQIKACFRELNLSTSYAVCGLSGPEVILRHFELPNMPAEDLARAIDFEASQVCPFDFTNSTVDYQILSSTAKSHKNSIHGIMAIANNNIINRYLNILDKTPARCMKMDVNGLALINCFTNTNTVSLDGSFAIINIGSKYSTVAIQGVDGIPFIRDIKYGIKDMINVLAASKQLSLPKARDIFNNIFADESESELVGQITQKLVNNLNETLAFYESTGSHENINTIFFCGGFALIKGTAQMLNKSLTAEVRIWNPLTRLYKDCGNECIEMLNKNGPGLALATGLAMRTF